MAEKLNRLYTNILSYASLLPDGAGKIKTSFVFDDADGDYVKIEGRELVLPTDENLKSYHPEKVVVFHPLQEFVNRGESDVVKLLRHQVNYRLNYTVLVVASGLLNLVASSAIHKELSPEQRELIRSVPEADPAAVARFTEFVVKRFGTAPGRFFCNVYLKKAGTFQGQKHARIGVVQFPYYEIFSDPDDTKKLKKGDEAIFKSIMQFIFPESDTDAEAYNNFSDHRDAPWLDCLLKTSYNLAGRLNELLKLYKPYIDDADKYLFNTGWIDPIDDLEPYRAEIRRIPSQKGNEGTTEIDGKEVSTLAPKVDIAKPQARREVPTSVPVARPVNRLEMLPPPEEPIFDRYGRCLNPPPIPDIVPNAEGKVDFRALKANNPMVAAAGMIQTQLTDWVQTQHGQYYDPRLGPPGRGAYPPAMQVDNWGRPIDPRYQHSMDPRLNRGVDPRFQRNVDPRTGINYNV